MSSKSDEPVSDGSHSPRGTVGESFQDRDSLIFKPTEVRDLSEAFFVSAGYDGERRVAFVKLYEPGSKRIYFWYDNTGHKPYCLSDLPEDELRKIDSLMKHQGFDHLEEVTKTDSLRDRVVKMTKIVATDPLSIGGRPAGTIRDILPKAWEADIRYYECFVYDRGLFPGMPYRVEDGKLVPVKPKLSADISKRLSQAFAGEPEEFRGFIEGLTDLFECQIPEFRRVALDIEVASDLPTRLPDPQEANYPVVCATLLGSDGVRRVLLLRREGVESGPAFPEGVKVEFYDREEDLVAEIFRALLDYPVVLTFNGDEFDLRYLYNRAERRFKFAREQIPIELSKQHALLKYGVHIDLYKFFFNRSLQIYAFSQRYRENTLDSVGEALIGKTKIEFEGLLNELTYGELVEYCYRDAEITMDLTTFDNDLVMKLVLILTRISRMPMDDVCRAGVSSWIRSLIYYEHRLRNYLIPRSEDLLELKGMTSTEALIKGKKYKGAIVVEPSPGVHFNVSVLDFASLYPSIIKVYNISYETVLCPHPDCRDNKVPDLPYWICRRRRGLSSLIIGAMRDMRVDWYKRMARDRSLPEPLRNLYNVVQLTLKVILNASYGVMGAEAFALYCPPVAEAVTAIGRHAFTETVEKAKSLGIEVVYGDSVSEDTKIFALMNDNVSEHRIEDLFKETHEEQEGKEYYYPQDLRILSLDKECKACWNEVKYVMRHRAKKQVYRVWLTNDWHIDVTEDHSLIGYENVKRLKDATLNDRLRRIRPSENKRMPLVALKFLPRRKVKSRHYSRELYEFLGFFVGDGSLERDRYGKTYYAYLSCGSEAGAIENRLLLPLRRQGKILNYHYKGLKGDIQLNGLWLVRSVERWVYGEGEKRIPKFIFNETEQNICSFLRGLFSADGTVMMRRQRPIVRYSTISKDLAEDIRRLLWCVGVSTSIYMDKRTNRYRDKDSGTHTFYVGVKTISKFAEKIGFLTVEKNERVNKCVKYSQFKKNFAKGDFEIARVRRVEKIEHKGYVYDVEVEGSHRFFGNGILLHNTDSIFLEAPTPEQIDELVRWSREELRMELEIDKSYRYAAFPKLKKNYLGVYPDGTVDIKGMTGKKRHTPNFLQEAFMDMVRTLGEVQSSEDFEKAKMRIFDIVKTCYLKLKKREYSPEDLAFNIMISKPIESYRKTTPQHVKAALLLQKSGVEVKPGDLISFVKVTSDLGVKPVKLVSLREVDVSKYMEYVQSTFEQVLDALGIDFKDIMGVTRLESFFGTS